MDGWSCDSETSSSSHTSLPPHPCSNYELLQYVFELLLSSSSSLCCLNDFSWCLTNHFHVFSWIPFVCFTIYLLCTGGVLGLYGKRQLKAKWNVKCKCLVNICKWHPSYTFQKCLQMSLDSDWILVGMPLQLWLALCSLLLVALRLLWGWVKPCEVTLRQVWGCFEAAVRLFWGCCNDVLRLHCSFCLLTAPQAPSRAFPVATFHQANLCESLRNLKHVFFIGNMS